MAFRLTAMSYGSSKDVLESGLDATILFEGSQGIQTRLPPPEFNNMLYINVSQPEAGS